MMISATITLHTQYSKQQKIGTYLLFPERSKEENFFWFFSMKWASSSPTSRVNAKLDSHFSSGKDNNRIFH